MDPRFQLPTPVPSSGGAAVRGHHRRAHSETFLRFPDTDLFLDPDGDFSFSDLDFPSLSDDSPALSDPTPPPPPPMVASSSQPPAPRPPGGTHNRSLSLDAAFFEGLALQGGGGGHKRSGSMDGVNSPFEGESALSGGPLDYAKKAMPAERIAELALLDPKRAKRILANRQSAAKGRGQNAPSPLARSSQRKNLGCDSNGQYWEEVYKHKLEQKYINQGEDRRSKLTSESNHLTFWSDSQTGDGSSPFRHSTGGGLSPYRRDVALSPSHKANGLFEVRDKYEKMSRSNGSSSLGIDHDHGSLLGSDHSSLKGSSSMSSGVDRTLHEDSMDHRSGIDSETSQLTLLLDPKTSLNSRCCDVQGERQIVRSNSIVEVQDNVTSTERITKVPESASLIPSGNAGSVQLDDRTTHDSSQDVPIHSEDNIAVKKESMPLQFLMPLPVPKSPSDSWLSRNLPSVKNKPPAPSFLGIQVQSKKQAPWASAHPKENDLKPPRPRQIRFADVVERPHYLDTEI